MTVYWSRYACLHRSQKRKHSLNFASHMQMFKAPAVSEVHIMLSRIIFCTTYQ